MKIEYRSKNIEKTCINISFAVKRYGEDMAYKIHLRIKQIDSAHTVEEMIENSIGRCHKLSGNRKNQYAMDLIHPKRLVFEKKGEAIQIAEIIEVVDYHR